MSWQCGPRIVADPSGATVSGTSMAGGAQVHIDVAFRLVEWPWEEKGPLSLVPQPSEVTARAGRGELRLGVALPTPTSVLSPARHSSTGTVGFTLSLTATALVALETARDGGPLELVITLTAYPFVISRYQGHAPGIGIQPTFDTCAFKVPKEQWLAVLKSVGYCESILAELRLPTSGPESTSVGRQRVVNAVNARNDGRYRNTVQERRIALDALKTVGFGGRAPRRSRTVPPEEGAQAVAGRALLGSSDRDAALPVARASQWCARRGVEPRRRGPRHRDDGSAPAPGAALGRGRD